MNQLGRTFIDQLGLALFNLLKIVAILLCLVPAGIVLVYSFYTDVFINFPPVRPGLGLYRELFTEPKWREAIWVSFELCIPAALIALLLVVPAAIALERADVPHRNVFEFIPLLPLLMPATAYAVGIYIIFLRMDWAGSYTGILFAEAVVATPSTFLLVRAAIRRLPHNLDQVAMSLGASRLRALIDITTRLLMPAILVAGLFAFIHAFNDATFIVFLAGPGMTTVSKTIFDSLAYALDPAVAALSGIFMAFVMLLVLVSQLLGRRSDRPRQPSRPAISSPIGSGEPRRAATNRRR